jgi:hypothetical protein
MNLQKLESMPFPKDFVDSVRAEAVCRFLHHSLIDPTTTLQKVKVLDAQYLEEDFTHVFTWHREFIGGAKDGLTEWADIRIEKDDDLKIWLFFLAVSGMVFVEKYGNGGLQPYLKAWSRFRVMTMGQTRDLITCKAGEFLCDSHFMYMLRWIPR